jgi:Immunity protein Imm1
MMGQPQRWVDLQRWAEGGQLRPLPATAAAIDQALREVVDDWSVELIVEVGDPTLRDCAPGNPKLIASACHGRLVVSALDIGPQQTTYHLIGDPAAVGEVAFTFGGQPGSTWPRRQLVDLDRAIAVAQQFLAAGAIQEAATTWELSEL